MNLSAMQYRALGDADLPNGDSNDDCVNSRQTYGLNSGEKRIQLAVAPDSLYSNATDETVENAYGETPLPCAPSISLSDGHHVVPQQFLDVNRSLASVEAILNCIEVPENFLMFAGEENGLVYLLCAVVGHENYVKHASQHNELKIVYGRRWLLEPSTPTSEVVQTAKLAIKKAREHELRERVVFYLQESEADQPKRTTPFNCHMDLPLMTAQAHIFAASDSEFSDSSVPKTGSKTRLKTESGNSPVDRLLACLRVDNLQPFLHSTVELSAGRKLYEIRLENTGSAADSFSDLESTCITVICDGDTQAEFLHSLFDGLLSASDRYIDETLSFRGFKRFSRSICPTQVAKFSYQTRMVSAQDAGFGQHFQDMSYRVDAAKAPNINGGELGEKQRRLLSKVENEAGALAGYLPQGYRPA